MIISLTLGTNFFQSLPILIRSLLVCNASLGKYTNTFNICVQRVLKYFCVGL